MRIQLRIGEVAQLVGVTPKTIRHYEKLGLLASPERSAGDYRLYGASEIVRLVHIRRLQALGLSLARIHELLTDSAGEYTLRQILEVLDQERDAEITTLEARRQRVRELLAAESSGDINIPAAVPAQLQRVADQIALPNYGPGSVTWEQDARIFGMLEALQLPPDVSAEMQAAIDHALQEPQHIERLRWLGERIAALADVAEDAPDVEQLAEAISAEPWARELLQASTSSGERQSSPLETVLGDVMLTMLSPAQRRLFQLLRTAPSES
jgi:DNA-binding transcriptional MerR regulator